MSVFDTETDKIESGTQIIHVRDRMLAAAMLAIGIPLRKDPPFEHVKKKDGTEIITYNFFPSTEDGDVTAGECIEAWKRDLDWIKENPQHPFTFAMCAVKNLISFDEHAATNVPKVGFKTKHPAFKGDAILLVKEGSKKHKAAIKRGLKQL